MKWNGMEWNKIKSNKWNDVINITYITRMHSNNKMSWPLYNINMLTKWNTNMSQNFQFYFTKSLNTTMKMIYKCEVEDSKIITEIEKYVKCLFLTRIKMSLLCNEGEDLFLQCQTYLWIFRSHVRKQKTPDKRQKREFRMVSILDRWNVPTPQQKQVVSF